MKERKRKKERKKERKKVSFLYWNHDYFSHHKTNLPSATHKTHKLKNHVLLNFILFLQRRFCFKQSLITQSANYIRSLKNCCKTKILKKVYFVSFFPYLSRMLRFSFHFIYSRYTMQTFNAFDIYGSNWQLNYQVSICYLLSIKNW